MSLSRVVFITGASSGIGRALARHYAGQGAILGLVARRAEVLDSAVLELRRAGAKDVVSYPLDVSDAGALRAAAESFVARFGAPDVVIANAGVSSGTLTECAEDFASFKRIFEINLFGMVATFAPFIAAMRQGAQHGRPGRLVGIASVAGIRGLPGAEAYSASKAAAITYLESLRLEMRDSGIKVVTIAPGYIATPMTAINPYRMPFLLSADEAAPRFVRAIERGVSYTVIPWPMGVVAKVLRLLPNALYDRLFAHAPRKPKVL
jgi:NAD(P)-dependent dehydrogenase (short-subunit alcohol dehydrogenase family)